MGHTKFLRRCDGNRNEDGDGKRAYLTLHSIMVPLLSTPSWVYMGFCGF